MQEVIWVFLVWFCAHYTVHTKENSTSSVTASHSEHSLCVSNPEHVAIFYNAFVLPFKNCMCLTGIVWNVALIPSTLLPDDKETSQAALGKLLWKRTGQYWNNVLLLYREESLAPQITFHSFSFAQYTTPILCVCVCGSGCNSCAHCISLAFS